MKNSNPNSPLTRRGFIAGGSAATLAPQIPGKSGLWAQAIGTDPVTETAYGKIAGRRLGGTLGFLGVPYGGEIEKSGRFMPPVKPTAWPNVKECNHAGPRSIQKAGSIFTDPTLGPYFTGGRKDGAALTDQIDSENCLNLNVLTPGLSGKRPVMVYIHGGGFTAGSAGLTVLSDRFVSESDVVLVGVNHRLNVFGYTYLGDLDPELPDSGNAGQLDLILALQWVQENIAQFGGNSENVTIFGESGGGAKISSLLATPSAKGLFHKAVIESGSARRAITKDKATARSVELLEKLGLSKQEVTELRTVSADKLFAASNSITGAQGSVVDGRSLPHQTWETGAPPEAAGIPLLVGSCKDESTIFSESNPQMFTMDWSTLKAKLVSSGIPAETVDKLVGLYKRDYPKDSASQIYFVLAADRGARANAIAQAESQLKQAPGHVYMYHFEWNTPVMDGKARAFHTAELPLAMRLTCYRESEALSKQIGSAWAAFARSGDPSHPGLPHPGLPKWKPYTIEQRATMLFDVNDSRLVDDPAKDEMKQLKPFPGGLL